MKRLSVLALALVAMTAATANAQTAAAPASSRPAPAPAAASAPIQAKVAIIAFQAAITQTNEFQRDFADLQKKYDPKRQQIKTLSDEIDSLTKQLQDQGAKLTDAERVNRSRTIDDKKKQLDRDTQDAQADFQNDLQGIMGSLANKVGVVMTDYADKHGYTLVLDGGDQQNNTVLFAAESTDITKAIIDAYNLKSGIPAPPPQAGAQPGAVDAPQPSAPAAH